jgi:DNA-binding MarR family transcriptional regulator
MPQNPQVNTAQLSRRAIAYSKKTDKKSRSLLLAQYLLRLKTNFPEFDLSLEKTIRTIRQEGSRTRRADRQIILTALETGCAELSEIADETELEIETAQRILNLFLRAGLISIVPRGTANDGARGARRDYYFLTKKACEKYSLRNPF